MIRRRTVSCTRRAGSSAGNAGVDLAQDVADERHRGDIVERKQIGAQAVVDVMGVIGDVIRQRGHLRFRARLRPQLQVLDFVVGEDRRRHAALGIAADRRAGAVGERAVVLDQAFQRFPGEIEPVEGGIAALQLGDDAQRLRVVIEAAEAAERLVERALAGMAERRMAEIVRQRQRLGEVLVAAERARQRAGDLRDFERMGEPRAVVVALVIDEHLRLVRQPAERAGMDDPVAIAPERVAGGACRLGIAPAPAFGRIGGINGSRAPGFDRHALPCPH